MPPLSASLRGDGTTLRPRARRSIWSQDPQDLRALVSEIEACGWRWNSASHCFALPGYDVSVRTQGLDLFDAASFRAHHARIVSGAAAHPEAYDRFVRGAHLARIGCSSFVPLFAVDLALGWLLMPFVVWIASLIVIICVLVAVLAYSRRQTAPYKQIENKQLVDEMRRHTQ